MSELRRTVFTCERDDCPSSAEGMILWTGADEDEEAVVPPPGWLAVPSEWGGTFSLACSEACAVALVDDDAQGPEPTSVIESVEPAPELILVVSPAVLRGCLRCGCVERPRVNEWPVPEDSTARICWCGTCSGACEYEGEVDPRVRAFLTESRDAGARDFPRAVVLPGRRDLAVDYHCPHETRLAAMIPGWRPTWAAAR